MENALLTFREKMSKPAYEALEKLIGYVSTHYAMDELYNGKGECKFRRGGKTLLTINMRENGPEALVVFGKEEQECFEKQREMFSNAMQRRYDESRAYHDGKWLFIPIADDSLIPDILRLVAIKKKPDEKAIAMCGYRCDLCKAYVKNFRKDDRRVELAFIWEKYYGLQFKPEDIYCDGCRCMNKDARRVDNNCPVRECVLSRNILSCADCGEYPCELFGKRTGLSYEKACMEQGGAFSNAEYEEFLLAYDNRTRLDRLKK